MRQIVAIVRPARFEAVKKALQDLNVQGMTVAEVSGHGKQKGHTVVYRGVETETRLLPKIRLEVVVNDPFVEPVVDAICRSARTGEVGDGKIFILPVEDVIRIRTGERGEESL